MGKKIIFRVPDEEHILSAPPFIQLELTSGCTQKCRHCYNFWRKDHFVVEKISKDQMDFLIEEFHKNRVMHVVLTGGEPLLNFDVLVYAIKELTKRGISVSMNSNLALATPEIVKELKDAGLPHVLVSLDASNAKLNDYLTSTPGAFEKITQGIKNTTDGGIRVSINMVITQENIDDIYETAKLGRELRCQRFNTTRTIPILDASDPSQKPFLIDKESAKKMIDETLRVLEDMDYEFVSTMIPYPYCFLGDLDKYAPFLEKTSCVAGTKLLAINSNGDVHACVHEANSYGNIFKKGLKDVWKNMQDWHTGKMFPDNCKVCPFFDECIAGCRIAAKAYFRDMSAEDNLRVGWKNITRPIDLKPTEKMYKIIETEPLEVVQSLRYRKEDNFYYITVFGAKGFIVENEVVDFLKEFKNKTFTLKEVGEDKKDMLALCYFYDLIQSTSRKEADKKKGNLKEFVKKD